MNLWAFYPVLVMVFVAAIDVNFKGRRMVTHKWHENPRDPRPILPIFWRDRGVIAWRSILAGIVVLAAIVGYLLSGKMLTVIGILLLASSGVESLLYWWLDPVFRIGQIAWWRNEVRVDHNRPVGWFDYPDEAEWIRILPFYWIFYLFEGPSRASVYVLAGGMTFIVTAMGLI